jgi:hypothetical protein
MNREPHSNYTFAITDCKLLVTWNDGKIEDLSPTLPDYLREESERYLDEMDDLRTERPEEYLMVNDKGEAT